MPLQNLKKEEIVGKMLRWSGGVSLSCGFPLAKSSWVRHSCSKLFVGGLSDYTNETVLKDAFRRYGEIIEVRVICEHVSGKSKGYGFVRFASPASADAALKQMNDQLLDGRNIRVHYANTG